MPPSPSLRFSSGRELRMETHKRGRSFESGLPVKVKDDDLALFTDMQMRERDNFLLCSNDDFDDSLSKLKKFSDFKLNIPVRGESSDLLNVSGEKNDYDWLLTPPETPLFPSLDDEPIPVNLVSRGRPRSQPITISKLPMTDKSHRTGRSSASPHRFSPSPRSGNGMPQLRGRPSSAPQSSPASILRSDTPSGRPSTPPNKPMTPTSRSSTPTLRRMNTGSGGNVSSSARRGTSPVKASRGNSSSPKLQGWQSNFPGFSSEPPPNLRTSISDRPASWVRGSSPASTNGRDTLPRSRRQSMSPTACRSVSSTQSNDRDNISSHSKGSVASSCDDDVELHSVNMETSASPTLKKNGGLANRRNLTFSKKPSRTVYASSAPKRSFDPPVRPMDQRKAPQNMFRPLLSSVPTSTFYIGKTNTMHRPMFSRNSSLTTSSNASSEQGASIAPDNEGSEHDQNDLSVEWEKTPESDAQVDMFLFDEVYKTEDIENEVCTDKPQDFHGDIVESIKTIESKDLEHRTSALDVQAASYSSNLSHTDHSDIILVIKTCSRCKKNFPVQDMADKRFDICKECAERDEYVKSSGMHTAESPRTTLLNSQSANTQCMGVVANESNEEHCSGKNVLQALNDQSQDIAERGPHCMPNVCPVELDTFERRQLADMKLEFASETFSSLIDRSRKFRHSHSFSSSQHSRIEGPELTGISVLLKRSNSTKGTIIQGQSFPAASISCLKPSHTRDSSSFLKGAVTWDSSSTYSSVNMGSSGCTESGIQGQLSNSSVDMDLAHESRLRSQSNETVTSNDLHEDLACNNNLLYSEDKMNFVNHIMPEILSALSPDLGILTQMGGSLQTQLSSSKNCESMRTDMALKYKITERSLSGALSSSLEDLATHRGGSGEIFSSSADSPQARSYGEPLSVSEQHVEYQEDSTFYPSCSLSSRTTIPVEDESSQGGSYGETCASGSELTCDIQHTPLENLTASDILIDKDSSVNSEVCHSQNMQNSVYEEMPDELSGTCSTGEHNIKDISPCRMDFSDILLESASGVLSELENNCDSLKCSQSENETSQTMCVTQGSHADSVFGTSEDIMVTGLDPNNMDHVHGDLVTTAEGAGGMRPKSLTLEEATDTILLCSSIVHDLAFKAAAIAAEKEHASPAHETRRPTVMLLGKPAFDEKNQVRLPKKRSPKTRKAKIKRLETDVMLPVTEMGGVVKSPEPSIVLNADLPNKVDSTKPPKPESKCNCTVM